MLKINKTFALVEFEFQFPVLMLKSKWPVDWMFRFGKKHKKIINFLGDLAIVLGFVGMIWSTIFLAKGTLEVINGGSSQVGIVIPGVKVPGSPVYIPLFEGLIAIFLLAIFHEGMHGIVAAANGLKSKFTALVLFLFIPAAGVELDEEKLKRKTKRERMRIFAAGSLGNFILAGLCFLLMFPAGKVADTHINPLGLKILNTSNADLVAGELIQEVNGKDVRTFQKLKAILAELNPGQEITLKTDKAVYQTKLNNKGMIGVYLSQEINYNGWLGHILGFLLKVLGLSVSLNLGVGLMNLLPLGILDGGRMFQDVSEKWYKPISTIILLLLLVNILGPFVL